MSTADALLIGWRILLLLGISISLAVHFAGLFLADIFELSDARVAWKYIERLAAGTQADVLHIREGRLTDENRKSTVIQIGGPGRVVVDDDFAVLFEKPDGTPHVAGAWDPAGGGRSRAPAAVELEGFERLREPLISLRDQYIGNPSGDPLTVVGRSLDGLPISVADVRGVFSVRRPLRPAGSTDPVEHHFAFSPRDIENLIYQQSVPVLTSLEYASGTPGDWTSAMRGLIRDSLREFMASNRLADFLAGVGANEVEQSDFRADSVLARTLQLSTGAPGSLSEGSGQTPRFRPRTELSAKFRKYGSEFSTRAQELGMELHWIGVGTWNMPDEDSQDTVSAKQIEAWRLNHENATRAQTRALEQVTELALLEHKLRLIREVPLARHARNQTRYSDKLVLMECLLQDYWEQLGDALDVHYRSGMPSRALDELEEAVAKVEQLLSVPQIGHVVGGGMASRIRKHEEWDRKFSRALQPQPRGPRRSNTRPCSASSRGTIGWLRP